MAPYRDPVAGEDIDPKSLRAWRYAKATSIVLMSLAAIFGAFGVALRACKAPSACEAKIEWSRPGYNNAVSCGVGGVASVESVGSETYARCVCPARGR